MELDKDYFSKLQKRAEKSHVHRRYQLLGLEISRILGDERHKALYIKLAKERGSELLLGIAKDVADRSEVKNKGAYFMRVVAGRPKSAWDDVAAQGETAVKNLFARKRRPAAKPKKTKSRKPKSKA